jgi:hypothetical protein
MILNRFEFDLMLAMTLVLGPLRAFTKFAQHKTRVTLAFIPKLVDELVDQLGPGAFAERLAGRADGVLAACEAFQAELVSSIKKRFSSHFEGDSLSLAASYFLPGKVDDLYRFLHFELDEDTLDVVRSNILSDVSELSHAAVNFARAALTEARRRLDEEDPATDPLEWWQQHPEFTILYPVAKMYLQIPASSAENERSFSSASFVLDDLRTRLDLDNFRREHRLRRFLLSGNPRMTADDLLQRFVDELERRRNED